MKTCRSFNRWDTGGRKGQVPLPSSQWGTCPLPARRAAPPPPAALIRNLDPKVPQPGVYTRLQHPWASAELAFTPEKGRG